MAAIRTSSPRWSAAARRAVGAAPGMAFLIAAALAPAPAAADVHTLATVGGWRLALTKTNNTGEPMCVIGTNDQASGRSIFIKYIRGSDGLLVHVFKSSWNVPRGADVPVELSIDNAPGWNAVAYGGVGGQGRGIGFTIGQDTIGRFEALFRAGSVMHLRFPQGSEATWRIALAGSNAIASHFKQCASTINGMSDTQPHATAPTQPHNAVPAPTEPTQPHTPVGVGPGRRT